MYTPTIGLEIHATLKTETKMFCGCRNNPEELRPNINVCPVCLGHPGTLPTINEKAVQLALRLGAALNGLFTEVSKFDRKNYFYPDLPKGYQISQYETPLIQGGMLLGVRIRRVHLEEDAGRLLHDEKGSLVDFNRAGTPLMELVTEPDIKSAKEAVQFAKELRLILRYCDVSDADMERGQMRIEVNVSVSPDSRQGTKVEIKNLNSFRSVEEAIDYEIDRQIALLKKRGKVIQETRGWDDMKKITVSQRTKEEAQDYRYFPEPDLPPLYIEKPAIDSARTSVPELPEEKRKRFSKEYYIGAEEATLLAEDKALSEYFENAVSELLGLTDRTLPGKEKEVIRLLYNYLISDLRGLMREKGVNSARETKVSPHNLAELIALIDEGRLNSRLAKDMLKKIFETGEDPRIALEKEGTTQISDEAALIAVVRDVITESKKAVADYKSGNTNALQFFIGNAMGKLKGKGNPAVLRSLFEKELNK